MTTLILCVHLRPSSDRGNGLDAMPPAPRRLRIRYGPSLRSRAQPAKTFVERGQGCSWAMHSCDSRLYSDLNDILRRENTRANYARLRVARRTGSRYSCVSQPPRQAIQCDCDDSVGNHHCRFSLFRRRCCPSTAGGAVSRHDSRRRLAAKGRAEAHLSFLRRRRAELRDDEGRAEAHSGAG